MKALPMKREDQVYIPCPAEEATHLRLNLPGPFPDRFMPIILKDSRSNHPETVWSWNGDTEKPTLRPSISTKAPRNITDEEADRIMEGDILDIEDIKCHTWINDGNVVFLGDCTHDLAGKTLPMNEVDV